MTEEQRAHMICTRAVKTGVLGRPWQCAYCGVSGENDGKRRRFHYHHVDYSRPLDVVPLCSTCHRRVHSGRYDAGLLTPDRMVTPTRPWQHKKSLLPSVEAHRPASFAAMLVACRQRRDLSQDAIVFALADLGVAVTRQAVSQWECGGGAPRASWLGRVCDVYGCAVEAAVAALARSGA